jgi:hypothetical protein
MPRFARPRMRDTAAPDEVVHVRREGVVADGAPADRVALDVAEVDGVASEHCLQQRLEERDVGADVGLQVEVGDLRPEEHAANVGGDAEAGEAQLADRVHDDHLPAAAAEVHEQRDEPRVVAGRVRAGDQDEVGLLQVVEDDGGGAGAVDPVERHPGRGVAVVGAVVDVPGAVGAGRELEEVGRLVARAAGYVEERLVRVAVAERRAGPVQRLVPADAAEVRVALLRDHREGEPPERLRLERRELLHRGDRRVAEPVLGDRPPHVGGLRLDRLLADLRPASGLVDHPALLPAHAERAGLAGVPGPEPAIELPHPARLAPLPEHVGERGQPTGGLDPGFRHGAP